MRNVVLAVLAGCAHSTPPRVADVPDEQPPDATRHYTIWLGGARVGTAIESEDWSARGVSLVRRESLRFLRGDAEVSLSTTIAIDADLHLHAHRVRWTESGTGGGELRAAEARRGSADEPWHLSSGGTLPATAVPAELAPLVVRRDGRFAGTIFLPARGFVAGSGRIDPVAPDRLVARLALEGGPTALATIDLDPDRSPARVVDGEGVIAIRTSERAAREPFEAVDLIAATAIPITGTRRAPRIVLDGDLALPAVPGQRARPSASGVELELSPSLAGELPGAEPSRDRVGEIRQLVTSVRARITPDLGAGPMSTRDAASATSGDCTTFALAYAALATERGIATRVVTGLRVDDTRLIRHRWAVSWTGTRWIAIDAAFGQAPAGGNLIGLAVHGADDAGLVAGEAALTQVRAASWSGSTL